MHCGTNPERVPRKTTAGASNAERVPGKTAERVHDVDPNLDGLEIVGKSAENVRDDSLDGLVFRLISGKDERTMSGLVCTAGHLVVGGIGVGRLGPTQDQLPE